MTYEYWTYEQSFYCEWNILTRFLTEYHSFWDKSYIRACWGIKLLQVWYEKTFKSWFLSWWRSRVQAPPQKWSTDRKHYYRLHELKWISLDVAICCCKFGCYKCLCIILSWKKSLKSLLAYMLEHMLLWQCLIERIENILHRSIEVFGLYALPHSNHINRTTRSLNLLGHKSFLQKLQK